eukprot:6316127-Amphidinium_carterae.1
MEDLVAFESKGTLARQLFVSSNNRNSKRDVSSTRAGMFGSPCRSRETRPRGGAALIQTYATAGNHDLGQSRTGPQLGRAAKEVVRSSVLHASALHGRSGFR